MTFYIKIKIDQKKTKKLTKLTKDSQNSGKIFKKNSEIGPKISIFGQNRSKKFQNHPNLSTKKTPKIPKTP
jgi:hypothetical protein